MAVIIELRMDEEPRPAARLAQLLDTGAAPGFDEAVTAARGAWPAICALEQDLLDLDARNRSAGAARGWEIVVGPCPLLEPVPGYLGWGDVSAWIESEGCALTIEEQQVVVRTAESLREDLGAVALARYPFGDSSAQRINHAIGAMRALEDVFADGESGPGDGMEGRPLT